MKRSTAMQRRRRGIIFSLISVLLSSFIILLFWTANAPRLDAMTDAARTRISVMDQHLTNWDAFTKDATRISTRAILDGLTSRIDPTSEPLSLDAVKANLTRCLTEGNASYLIVGGGDSYCYGSVDGSLFAYLDDYARFVNQELGLETSYAIVEDVAVEDYAPFELRVSFGIQYLINDSFARWNRTVYYKLVIPVEGLADPLFEKYGASWMKGPFVESNFTRFAIPRDRLNPGNVSQLIIDGAYVENVGLAPTYLERMTLNLSLDFDPLNSSGIERLIDPFDTLLAVGRYKNKSFVAHQIFADLNFTCGNKTIGINRSSYPTIPDNFRLDVPHLGRYGFNGTAGMLNYSCS
jgi:hypothetical protein